MKLNNIEKDTEKHVEMGGAICGTRFTSVELSYEDFKYLTTRSPEEIKTYLIMLMSKFTIGCRI